MNSSSYPPLARTVTRKPGGIGLRSSKKKKKGNMLFIYEITLYICPANHEKSVILVQYSTEGPPNPRMGAEIIIRL